MKLSRNQVDYLAFVAYKAMKASPAVTLKDPDRAVGIVRSEITENLRAEEEIEREALELLRKHQGEIDAQGADFRRILEDGKRALARKRGITL